MNRVALVRPDTAKIITDRLIQMAQTGQMMSKIDNGQLIAMLEQVQKATKKETTIKVRIHLNFYINKY